MGRRGKCHDATFLELEWESTDLAQDQQADQVTERRVVADDHQAVRVTFAQPVPDGLGVGVGAQDR